MGGHVASRDFAAHTLFPNEWAALHGSSFLLSALQFHDRGEQGYIYLSRDDKCSSKKGECGLLSEPSFPTAGSSLAEYDSLPDVTA